MSKNSLNLDSNFLFLSWPEDISSNYVLNEIDKFKINQLLNLFSEAVNAQSKEESATKLSQCYSILGSIETFLSCPKHLTLAGSLKQWEVYDYDSYFDVKREQTHDSPAFLIARSILMAYQTFLNLRYFNQKNPAEYPDSLFIWKRYHWLFFIFIQGNILCMLHLKKELRQDNILRVGTMLKSMSKLMLASGAAMLFAGASPSQEYQSEIRPTMMPPSVKSPEFSGIMSYDHSYIINLWNKEKGLFKLVPSVLSSAYEDFLDAHKFMALAHKFVCHKYGRNQEGSLREKRVTALENLETINNSRRKLIINSNDQLLDSDTKLILTDESEYEKYIKIGFVCYSQLLIKSLT
ncbi:MAG TPA: hypothetical protein IGS52_04880 [Oscillatoriaceae cyanobacterium M33_DOE_052]|uniref:Uncharacterized protein n=1 Tax=Planktothricoides sp. SpSt-374 TaxID=2282167 RepID=A0A7C3ZW82_9CYAN|nr:hypothetical protein [Oscillatoriaceae cyanobacterium M33_DOE_052]